MHKLRPRLTYANVVATVCLFMLLGGGAYAAEHYVITSTDQIKPSVLAKLAGPGRGTEAKKKTKRGPAGPQGPQGTPGANGSARAYTEIVGNHFFACNPQCNKVTAQTKGITSVTYNATGIYCIQAPGIDPATTDAVTTVVWNGTTNPFSADATIRTDRSGPCDPNDFEVRTGSAGAATDDVTFNFAVL